MPDERKSFYGILLCFHTLTLMVSMLLIEYGTCPMWMCVRVQLLKVCFQ